MRRSPGYGGHRTDRLRRRRPEVSVGEACGPLGNIILTIEHGDLGRLIAVRTDPGVLAVIRREGRQLRLSLRGATTQFCKGMLSG